MTEVRSSGLLLAPPSPPEINHVVLTGTLSADPQVACSPRGGRVVLLRMDFPVAHPDHPRLLWTPRANSWVEVPAERADRAIEQLRPGAPLLAAGRLSERWMIEGGHTSRRGVIVAAMVKAGPNENRAELPR